MKRYSSLVDSSIFFLLGLLTFLVVLESFVQLPGLLQVVGRLHPLVLHLPIGFVVALSILPLAKGGMEQQGFSSLQVFFLRLLVLSLLLSALAGFFLAQESGYESKLVDWHKWTATGSCYLSYALLVLKKNFPERSQLFSGSLYASLLAIMVTGHLGGSITHGRDYLLAPIKASAVSPSGPDAPVYAAAIQPIFREKCTRCHNNSKRKGGLSMASAESLLAGGKNGPLWLAGDPAGSLILQRIHLPLKDEEHMPPEDQAQLSVSEIALLEKWISRGADFEQTIGSLSPGDSLLALLPPQASATESVDAYDFPPAAARDIEQLNTPYRTVRPLAQGAAALSVEFFIQQAFEARFISELSPVRKQVVSINLSNMPLDDAALKALKPFEHLEQLILNGSNITGAGLKELQSCSQLKRLALSNTDISKEDLLVLATLSELKTIYAWETNITVDDLSELAKHLPGVEIILGYEPQADEPTQLSPPSVVNEHTVLAPDELIALKTRFPGAVIRYTINGDEPDSLSTPFTAPFAIREVTRIKARTFSEGWLPSKTTNFTFFPGGIQADTSWLLQPPNPGYPGEGASTLNNREKGDINNFKHPAWLGYQENPLSAIFDFGEQPPRIARIVGSFGQNIAPEIFLPKEIRVYGGNEPGQMQLLGSTRPPLPEGYEANQVIALPIEIVPAQFRYYRIEAFPYTQLPAWHQSVSSGRKTWVFVDEVFFY